MTVLRALAAALLLAPAARAAEESIRVSEAPRAQTTLAIVPAGLNSPLLSDLHGLIGVDQAETRSFDLSRAAAASRSAPQAAAAPALAVSVLPAARKRAVVQDLAEVPLAAFAGFESRAAKTRGTLVNATISLGGGANRSLGVLFDNIGAHHAAPIGPLPGVNIPPAANGPSSLRAESTSDVEHIAPLLGPNEPQGPRPSGKPILGKVWGGLKAGLKFINAGPQGWKGFTAADKEAFKKTLSGVELIFMLLVTWYILYRTTNLAGLLLMKSLARLIPATAGTVGSLAGKLLYFASLLKLWNWIEFFIAYALFKASRFKPKFALLALPLIPWNLPEIVQLLGKLPFIGGRIASHPDVVFLWIPALLFFWPFMKAAWARLRRKPT